MSSSEVYSDETFSSNESEPDYVDEYELEVEMFDVGVTSHETRGKASEDSVATAASIFPTRINLLLTQNKLKNTKKERRRKNFILKPLHSD